ncbi:MAG: dihydrofolate reductase [Sphingobacteriales bacterium]|nr:MAG: dihydrofolate reductase [Sphingobacteriales bacterium]
MISLVVAAAENNAIGKNNQLLWHLPNDLKFFKNTTWAGVVIMGRKTFESVNKPLPGRLNIVITSNADWKFDTVKTATGLQEAIDIATAENFKEIFIIGGGEIYKQAMPMANVIYMTRVHTNLEADTFFPEIKTNEWQLIRKDDVSKDEKHAYDYSFERWEKIYAYPSPTLFFPSF